MKQPSEIGVTNDTDTTNKIPEVIKPTVTPSVENSPIKINQYPNRTASDLNSAIIKAAPMSLVSSVGKANFTIVSFTSPVTAWYIVTVRLTNVQTDDAKIILKDNGTAAGGLVIVAGPGTTFPDTTNFPPQVRVALS